MVNKRKNYRAVKILLKNLPDDFKLEDYFDRLEDIENELLQK